jgi:phosphonate degradation associated HDIG domain protein
MEKIVSDILELYSRFGAADYIGEPVSQIEHMGQAAQLAMAEGYDDEVTLAAFFHDIGHLCVAKMETNDLNGLGIRNHERVGADYLRTLGFPEKIAALVEGHVEAKRYLCYNNPNYFHKLSEASKKTLALQGGVMDMAEAISFELNPLAPLMIKMRQWDDEAKKENVPIIDFEILKEKMLLVLSR